VPPRIVCDVAIIGSGAVPHHCRAKAGLKVIVEEGPLRSSSDFNQHEADAYPSLYQEAQRARPRTRRSTSCRGGAWAAPPRSTG
jgi:hypothetical protein